MEINETRKGVHKRVRMLLSFFASEYIEDLAKKEIEDAAIRTMEENLGSSPRVMVLTAENNSRVMLDCMKDCNKILKILYDEDVDVEDWQLAGMNAIFDRLNESHEIPYDLPAALLGLLLAQYIPKYDDLSVRPLKCRKENREA